MAQQVFKSPLDQANDFIPDMNDWFSEDRSAAQTFKSKSDAERFATTNQIEDYEVEDDNGNFYLKTPYNYNKEGNFYLLKDIYNKIHKEPRVESISSIRPRNTAASALITFPKGEISKQEARRQAGFIHRDGKLPSYYKPPYSSK